MASGSRSEQVDLRSLLEPGVQKQAFEQAFATWMAAPNNRKSDLLLTGPALSWAEGWMLANPDVCSATQKRYIVRSLAKQSGQAAGGMRAAENDQLRNESRIYWLVIAVAAFVVFTAGPQMMKEGFERSLNGAVKPDVAAKIAAAPAKNQMTMTTTIGPEGQAPVTIMKRSADEPAIAVTEDAPLPPDPAPAQRVAIAVAPKLATRTLQDLAKERSRQLLDLSEGMATKGDTRAALLVAVEAMKSAAAAETAGADDRSPVDAGAASLFRAMMTQTPLLEPQSRWTEATPPRFCGDGRRVLASSDDERPVVFDSAGGKRLQTFGAPEQLKAPFAVDRDCTRAVLAVEDYGAQIVSLATGKPLARMLGHETDLTGLAFSADGTRVVTASGDRSARIWDAADGRQLADLRGHDGGLNGALFSPDGRLVATWSQDRTVRLWEARTGRETALLAGHRAAVTDATFSADGTRLATTSLDGIARLWDVATGKAIARIEPRQSSIIGAQFSGDGGRLVTLTQESHVEIWDGRTGKPLGRLGDRGTDARSVVLSRDAGLIATVSWSGIVTLWNSGTGERISDLNRSGGRAMSATFSPDGRSVVAISQDGALLSWPVFASLDGAVAHALQTAGACLTQEERTSHQLDPALPEWCTNPDTMRR